MPRHATRINQITYDRVPKRRILVVRNHDGIWNVIWRASGTGRVLHQARPTWRKAYDFAAHIAQLSRPTLSYGLNFDGDEIRVTDARVYPARIR